MEIKLGTHKRGDTFAFSASISDASDQPITGIAGQLRCQMRDKFGFLIAELQVTETSVPGTYGFQSVGSTQNWKLGQHYIDFEYTSGNIISSSPTYLIEVIKDVTRDA